MRLIRTILIVLAAFAVMGGAVFGGLVIYKRFFNPVEKALAELKGLPLMGLVLADVPGAEAKLRAAIEQELRQPTPPGQPTRPLLVVLDLRRDYITPALLAADDATATGALAAQAALIGHLLKTKDTAACREFASGGIQRVDRLDLQGQQLFRDTLSAVEAAYRSGHASGKRLPMPTGPEYLELLREAGLQKADFDKINSFATLSNEVSCEVELKIYSAPETLPAPKRGPFARYILAN